MANAFDRPVSKYNKGYKESWDSDGPRGVENKERTELTSAVDEFLAKGGKITKGKTRARDPLATLNRGVSAR